MNGVVTHVVGGGPSGGGVDAGGRGIDSCKDLPQRWGY